MSWTDDDTLGLFLAGGCSLLFFGSIFVCWLLGC